MPGPSKPTFKKKPVPKNAVKPIKKPTSPLKFRTEKGDVTNYTTKFVPTPQLERKVIAPTKPKYDSVLDSAWTQLETITKEPKEDAVPVPEEIPLPPQMPISESSDDDDSINTTAPINLAKIQEMQTFHSTSGDFAELQDVRDGFIETCLGDVETLEWVLNDDVESDEEGAI